MGWERKFWTGFGGIWREIRGFERDEKTFTAEDREERRAEVWTGWTGSWVKGMIVFMAAVFFGLEYKGPARCEAHRCDFLLGGDERTSERRRSFHGREPGG